MIIDLSNYHPDLWLTAATNMIKANQSAGTSTGKLYTTWHSKFAGKLVAVELPRRVNKPSDAYDVDHWCREQFGSDGHGDAWVRNIAGQTATYYFRSKADAALFKLTWG